MYRSNDQINVAGIMRQMPSAMAFIEGSPSYPDIRGTAKFYQLPMGVLVAVEVYGLPASATPCQSPVLALHVHEGATCSGNATDYFANARTHYNPYACLHPYHAGDMPPLFSAGGMAFSAFLTDRFTVDEIIGKTLIIHDRPDDFVTQPSGNAGQKIACGEITQTRRHR